MDGKKLVAKIKSLVVSRGMSMAEFYKKSGITGGAMSQWKSGETQPALSSLQRIADVLGTTVSELVGADEETKTPATENGDGYGSAQSDTREEINRLLPKAPEWLQDQILALLRAAESGRTSPDGDPKDA